MSVDKFGRRSHRQQAKRGPKGEGFNLTAQGDYDVQKKRIRYLEDPVENDDAVNLQTLQSGLFKCIQLSAQGTDFDAQKKRIGNANDPVAQDDLTTKRYVDENTPENKDSFWSFKHKRLSNVSDPLYDGEVVNLSYLKTHSLVKDHKSNIFDAQNTVLTNLAPPSYPTDAVNKNYLEHNALLLNPGNVWDFNNKRLTNVSDPDGNAKDAVNYGYLNRSVMCKLRPGKDWDGRWCKIKCVSFPDSDGDVVTKGYLRHQLGPLAYYIYSELKTKGGGEKNVTLYPYEKWISEAFSTPWSELFGK